MIRKLPKSKLAAPISGILMLVTLTGCGNDDVSDLNHYIQEVKARPKSQIEPLPEIKVVEPFIFNPDGLRDPFKESEQDRQAEAAGGTGDNGLRPDLTRRKEDLEAFPLDGLRMAGTVVIKSSLWGLVKASDGTIHRVKVGNYMGKNYGKIVHISKDKIELVEIVPDKPGTWREQQAVLTLTE